MTHPVLTWSATAPRAIAVAGASSTVAELLTAIKAAIDNDSTLWETSAYSAGAYLEVKRKVSSSPAGEQATVRFLYFGGSVPNAAALLTSVSAGSTNLYVAGSVDANTTGPTTAFTTGAMYASKFMAGQLICAGNALSAAQTPKVSLVESVDCLAVWLGDIDTWASAIMGRIIIEAATDTLFWGIFPSQSATTVVTNPSVWLSEVAVTCVIPYHYGSGANPRCAYWNNTTGTCRTCGRNFAPGGAGATVFGGAGVPSMLMAVPLMESSQTIGATQAFLGTLRQVRFGPAAQHNQTMRTALGVLLAQHFGPPFGVTGYGAWFDEAA